MNENDDKLRDRLRQWRSIEPRADFEAAVWQRIAATTTAAEPGQNWLAFWRTWLDMQPAWASVAAVLVGILVGVGSAVTLAQPSYDRLAISTPSLHGQTLTGNYLAMTSGGSR